MTFCVCDRDANIYQRLTISLVLLFAQSCRAAGSLPEDGRTPVQRLTNSHGASEAGQTLPIGYSQTRCGTRLHQGTVGVLSASGLTVDYLSINIQ